MQHYEVMTDTFLAHYAAGHT